LKTKIYRYEESIICSIVIIIFSAWNCAARHTVATLQTDGIKLSATYKDG
jgi:hypothetical protein